MGDCDTWGGLKNPEVKSEYSKQYCFGCLCFEDEKLVENYKIQCGPLMNIFQMDIIRLCYLCKRIAQHTEHFIQSVQKNQILLDNFHNEIDETLLTMRMQTQPLVNLSHLPIDIIELSGQGSRQFEDSSSALYHSRSDVLVKVEFKEEKISDQSDEESINGDDDFSDSQLKDEDGLPPKKFLKDEIEFEDAGSIDLISLSEEKKGTENVKVKTIYITREQCMEERSKMSQDKVYLGCVYKCENCIKGFNMKGGYERHLEKHSQSMGDFECDICKQRMDTHEKLVSHMKYHLTRYRCTECGLTRICRVTIKDHYSAYHCQGRSQYTCPHCNKSFNRERSFRKHVASTHKNKERVECAFCKKSYASKEVLKSHMLTQHTKEVSAGPVSKNYVCQECGMAFKAPSLLRIHSTKHSHRRDFYCAECDKSFKSDATLKKHLKIAVPHVNYLELPFSCLHCDKRFAIRRYLERHMNRVHLNVRPFTCEKCDKSFESNWSLTQHMRSVHEGYKRPLQYPCRTCDKVFDRKQLLDAHIRTHTGERPFHCSKCSAQFCHFGSLKTHDRLIHLNQTRNGRPKVASMK